MSPRHPLLHDLLDATLAGLLALLLFGPITGLILSGYQIEPHLERPLLLAGTVFAGRLIISLLRHHPKGNAFLALFARRKTAGVIVTRREARHPLFMAAVVLGALSAPFFLSNYGLSVAILALIYVLLGLGLNIVVGLAGLLDLGFVAFYAVGAYGYALGSQYLGLGFWSAIPFSALLAATFGMLLGFPVLRMHGDYLAIVTLGFGEIVRLLLNNWLEFTGGPNGVAAPAPTFLGLEFTRTAKSGGTPFHQFIGMDYSSSHKHLFLYAVLLVVVAGMIFFVARLKRMPMGRAWEALREDEIACRSLGINHVTVKLSAFALGAMSGGVGGVFFAASQGFVNPASFTFFESALILAIVVLGGMGSTTGVAAAAMLLTILPEMLREFASFRILFFGILMVLMMVWRPGGLLTVRRPAFDLSPLADKGGGNQ